MNTVTCNDFNGFKKDTTFAIVMWLDAYYRDDDDPPIIDFDKFAKNSEKLGKYCGENPGDGLITAADQVMGK